jgi:hypothetical protein
MSKPVPLTEGELVERLRARYSEAAGNGAVGALIPGVRDAAGFDACRTIDAIGVNFWPSRGLLLDGYECKSSRSDWQRELAEPAKAERFCELVDRFWIVAGRADLVLEAELPPDWGLLVPRGKGLTQVRPAAILHPDENATGRRRRAPRPLPPAFDRGFLIALLRQASAIAAVTPAEIEAARDEAYEAAIRDARAAGRDYKDLYAKLRAEVDAWQRGTGVPLTGWSWRGHDPAAVGAAVKAALNGEHTVTRLEDRLRALLQTGESLVEQTRKTLGEYGLEVSPPASEGKL